MTRATRTPIAPLGADNRRGGQNQFGGPARDTRPKSDAPDFLEIHSSPEFVKMKRRFRLFVFPMSALFLSWYMTFVLLAAYAPEFMSRKVLGAINVGLVLGLLQFVSLMVITTLYSSYMKRKVDPLVAEIRDKAGVNA